MATPAIDDYIAQAAGDQITLVPPGTYRVQSSVPFSRFRPSTTATRKGWAIIQPQDGNRGSVVIDGTLGGFFFDAIDPARALVKGFAFHKGTVRLWQPMLRLWYPTIDFDPAYWATQGSGFVATQINTTVGSNVVTAAPGTFTGHVGHYLQATQAGLGGPDLQAPTIASRSTDGSQATLSGPNNRATVTRTATPAYIGANPAGSAATGAAPLGNPDHPNGLRWAKTFAEDFPGTALDPTRWTSALPWGSGGVSFGVQANTNLQIYRPENIIVSGGTVKLRATAQSNTFQGVTKAYKSGCFTSYDKVTFDPLHTPTLIECRMRMVYGPTGAGLWPAFWLLAGSGGNFPWPPEFDIMELFGTLDRPFAHGFPVNGSSPSQSYGTVDLTQWHTLGVLFAPTEITGYLDGVQVWSLTNTTTIAGILGSGPLYLLANLALDPQYGDSSGQTFPADFELDYVYGWQGATVLYERNVALDLGRPRNGARCADTVDIMGADISGAAVLALGAAASNLRLHGCRLTDPVELFDPLNVDTVTCLSLGPTGGIENLELVSSYLEGKVALADALTAGAGATGALRGLLVDDVWHDYFGGRVGLELSARADPRTGDAGIFGQLRNYRAWTSAANPLHRVDTVYDVASGQLLVLAPNAQPTRCNLVETNVARGAAPSVDPMNDANNPALKWRATVGRRYDDQDIFFGWDATSVAPPSFPRLFSKVFAARTTGTSVSVNTTSDTPAGATLVVAVTVPGPGQAISAPAGWDVLPLQTVSAVDTTLVRFVRNTVSAGGVETLGPFTSATGHLNVCGVAVTNAAANPLVWDTINAGPTYVVNVAGGGGGPTRTYRDVLGWQSGFSKFGWPGWNNTTLVNAVAADLDAAWGSQVRVGFRGSEFNGGNWTAANVTTSSGFAPKDQELDYAVQHGAKVVIIGFHDFIAKNASNGGVSGGMGFPDINKVADIQAFVHAVLNRYIARYAGRGITFKVELWNEPNTNVVHTDGVIDPSRLAEWSYRLAGFVHEVDATIPVRFGNLSVGPGTNNTLDTYGTSVFGDGGSGTISFNPIDYMNTILNDTAGSRYPQGTLTAACQRLGITKAQWVAAFSGWNWHSYTTDPFNALPARGATWPNQPMSGGLFRLPLTRAFNHIAEIKEIWQWWKNLGMPDSKNRCDITEIGFHVCNYWQPGRAYRQNEQVFLSPQHRGTTDAALWNSSTRSWGPQSTRYRAGGAIAADLPPPGNGWVVETGAFSESNNQPWEPNEAAHYWEELVRMAQGERPDQDGVSMLRGTGVYMIDGLFVYIMNDQGPETTPAPRSGANSKSFLGATRDSEGHMKGYQPAESVVGRLSAIGGQADTRDGVGVTPTNRYQPPGTISGQSVNVCGIIFVATDLGTAFVYEPSDPNWLVLGGSSGPSGGRQIAVLYKHDLPRNALIPTPSVRIDPATNVAAAVATLAGTDALVDPVPSGVVSMGAVTLQ